MMTDELLPCPFCGASPEIFTDGRHTWGLLKHKTGCLWYFPNFPDHKIPAQDFKAWNVRYERTCKRELVEFDEYFYCYKCDECGYPIDNEDSYCAGCGALVVVEE